MTTGLAKKLGFWDIYLMSLGQIIGAGIFILIGKKKYKTFFLKSNFIKIMYK